LYDAKADLPPNSASNSLIIISTGFPASSSSTALLSFSTLSLRLHSHHAGPGRLRLSRFYERKAHFLQSVPYALKNLRWLLHNVRLPIPLPALMNAFKDMLSSEKLQGLATDADNLVVRIFSFSFHQSLPKDETGNGGGFIFDGRSLPNPGREERFKALTGKDAPVIEYLQQQESVHQFLASVLSLVDATIGTYQQRRFKNLMVSFGCTGGQHRSVYLANNWQNACAPAAASK